MVGGRIDRVVAVAIGLVTLAFIGIGVADVLNGILQG